MGRHIVIIFMLTASVFLTPLRAMAIDIAGVQPSSPYGIFSTIMTNSPAQGHSVVTVGSETTVKPGYTRFMTELATGVTDNIEFGLTIPYIDREGGGLEDISFSIKHRVMEETLYSPSVAYILTGAFDTGVDESTTDGSVGAGVILSKRAGPFRGHLNLLYNAPFDRNFDDDMRFAAGIDFSATNSSKLLAEFVMSKNFSSHGFSHEEARVGYRFIYDEGLFTTVGMGMDVGGSVPNYRVMASISVLFPRVERLIEKVYEEGN